jgi:dihydroflavonol-4-reductase
MVGGLVQLITVLVTGGTGLTGANVCQQLIARGDMVRALVRDPDEAGALAALGVELIQGDIAVAEDVLRAGKGCEAAIHCAALLGGASQDIHAFRAVNVVGTSNVFEAAEAHGMRRTVALSTATFLDLSEETPYEQAPVLEDPPSDPYSATKLEAFLEAIRRTEAGQDIAVCHPGAIYGPGLVINRALHRTSFNAVLRGALRGKIPGYLSFPVTWVAAADVAAGSIAALDRGVAGERYWLTGRPEDRISTAAGCNLACEIAGVPYRVEDVDHRTDPDTFTTTFGPTLMAIAEAAACEVQPARPAMSPTRKRLDYQPRSIDDGMRLFIDWLREIGKL